MTTNNPPIAAWAPGAALAKLASRHNNSPCVLTDGPAEFNDVALIRLSDYEALQAELESLKEHAELGKAVQQKREPGKRYGCHCDIDEGVEPDGCVIDEGRPHYCVYAKRILAKEQCEYWRVITSDADQEHQP